MPYKNKPGAIALSLKELEDPLDIVKREQLLKKLKEWEASDPTWISPEELFKKHGMANMDDVNVQLPDDLLESDVSQTTDTPSVNDLRIWEIMNKYRPGYKETKDGIASLATDTSFVNQPASVPEPSEDKPTDDEPANVDYPKRDNSARKFELQRMIDGYDRDIAKLQAEIAMSEAGDPMYDLAIMRLLMDDDNSLLMDIRGRISKRIDQEFQERMKEKDQEFTASENEKNRQSTEKIAGMNKAEQDAAKKQERDNAIELATDTYMTLKRKLNSLAEDDPRRAEIEDQVGRAEILMKQAYRKANKLNEYNEVFGRQFEGDETIGERKTMLYKSLGVADDREFQDLYNGGDAAQKAFYEKQAKYVGIPLTKLGVSGSKAKDDQKKEQTEKLAKKRADFKNANKDKKFEINLLTGKPKDTQKAENWLKEARAAGWSGIEIQSNGLPLWK